MLQNIIENMFSMTGNGSLKGKKGEVGLILRAVI